MRKFEIARYLKKYLIIVIAFVLLGTSITYFYINRQQRYTASVTLQFKNSGISEGLAPDGSKFDPTEIYSTPVISNAMEQMNSSGSLNIIRSRCAVSEVIPEDQKKINNAKLEKGEEVTYFPDKYTVSVVVEKNYGPNYARNALEAIIQSYCTYYTEKYVERPLSLNPTANLVENGYEYYQSVCILEDDTESMLQYLKTKKDDYPNFRSSKTGYSYADLYEKYCHFRDYTIPELYSAVLTGPQIKDGNVLREYLANQISNSVNTEQNASQKRQLIKSLIDHYVNRNRDISGGTINGADEYEQSVLHQIEHSNNTGDTITTYDGLILKLVEIDKSISDEQINRAFQQEISAAFGEIGTGSSGTAEEHEKVEQLIKSYETELTDSYELVRQTGKELNSALSDDYFKVASSVRVYQSINERLYLVLAFGFSLVIGIAAVVILGRLGDYLYYLFSVDKKTKLPNRERTDAFIEKLSKKLLPENYSCLAFNLVNLTEVSSRLGYKTGDTLLADFSAILRLIEEDGFVGYNGAGMYVAFVESCTGEKAAAILSVIRSQVEEHNRVKENYAIEFSAAYSNSTDDCEYQARQLLKLAVQKSLHTNREAAASPAGDVAAHD